MLVDGARRRARAVVNAAGAPLRLRLYRDGRGAGVLSRAPLLARLADVELPVDGVQRRIEIGSGPRPEPGYIHVDTDRRAPHVEAFAPAWRLPFATGWAEELRAVHVLEHVPVPRLDDTVREWHRVLAPGGVAQVHVPNGPELAQAYLSGSLRDQWRASAALLGMTASPDMSGPDDLQFPAEHQVIFSLPMLRDLFHRAGFARVEDVTGDVSDVHTEGWRDLVPHCSLVVRAHV